MLAMLSILSPHRRCVLGVLASWRETIESRYDGECHCQRDRGRFLSHPHHPWPRIIGVGLPCGARIRTRSAWTPDGQPAGNPGGLRDDSDRYRLPGRSDCRGSGDRRDQVGRGPRAGSQKTTSHLSAAGRQTTWPADQLQRGANQRRHYAYRQWTRTRVSRKVARTPRTPVKLRLVGLRSKTSLALAVDVAIKFKHEYFSPLPQ